LRDYKKNDHTIVKNLMAHNEALMRERERKIAGLSGEKLFDFLVKDFEDIKATIFDSYGAVFAGTYASTWINKNMKKWLGEKNAADTLAQSVPDNVTSEMGLELLDIADIIRRYP